MSNYDIINRLGLILETYSIILLKNDFNNKDLMKELQNQDEKYLTKIIQQNEEIIKLLTKGSDKSGRKVN